MVDKRNMDTVHTKENPVCFHSDSFFFVNEIVYLWRRQKLGTYYKSFLVWLYNWIMLIFDSWLSDIVQFQYVHVKNPHHMHCYRSVALRKKFVLTDCKASVSHIKRKLNLIVTKICTGFEIINLISYLILCK